MLTCSWDSKSAFVTVEMCCQLFYEFHVLFRASEFFVFIFLNHFRGIFHYVVDPTHATDLQIPLALVNSPSAITENLRVTIIKRNEMQVFTTLNHHLRET